jgi:hypothetical protein
MTIGYTIGIPATNNNPSTDQPNMQVNNDNNFAIWGVDHCTFNVDLPEQSGQHHHVTFPITQSDPVLDINATQLYPKVFGSSTQLLETYTAGRMSNNQQINGYLPFVKAMAKFIPVLGPYPKTLSVPANTLNVNIASIVQSGVGTVTVTFITALPYNTYYIFVDPTANIPSITKNTTSIVFGSVAIGATAGFMVI